MMPPLITVGSRCAASSMQAIRLVVVVLPWVPPTAMAHFRRINSASISARRTTGMKRARAAHDLRVVALHGGGNDDHPRIAQIGGVMADRHRDAGLAQPVNVGGVSDIGALHGIAKRMQHLGDARHADAADPDEMHPPNRKWQRPHDCPTLGCLRHGSDGRWVRSIGLWPRDGASPDGRLASRELPRAITCSTTSASASAASGLATSRACIAARANAAGIGQQAGQTFRQSLDREIRLRHHPGPAGVSQRPRRWRSDGRRSRPAAAPGSRAGRRSRVPRRSRLRRARSPDARRCSRSATSGKNGASSAAIPLAA